MIKNDFKERITKELNEELKTLAHFKECSHPHSIIKSNILSFVRNARFDRCIDDYYKITLRWITGKYDFNAMDFFMEDEDDRFELLQFFKKLGESIKVSSEEEIAYNKYLEEYANEEE